MIVIFILLMLGGVAFAVWRFLQTMHEPIVRRVADVIMALVTGVAAFMLIERTMQIAISDWNDAKLAPIIAMTRGYKLYQDPQSGVMTGWIYGPIAALILLPASLAKSPTTAGLIGSVITAITYFAPPIWLFFVAARGRVKWVLLLAVLVIVWKTIYLENLCRCAFIASPDGPALGLAACACATIYFRRAPLNLAISAISAILCVWTKQNFLSLIPGLVIWVALADGWKTAAMYLLWIIGLGLVISAALLLSFGASNMLFHMYTLPRQHPFTNEELGKLRIWYTGVDALIIRCIPSIQMVCLTFLLDAWVRKPAKNILDWFGSRGWSVLLVTAIFLIPSSLLGYMKVGGYENNLACTDYFLVLTAMCGVLEACSEVATWSAQSGQSGNARPSAAQKWIMAIVAAAMSVFIFPMFWGSALGSQNTAYDIWPSFAHPYDNPREVLYNYGLAHQQEIYCPWNPLITLMTDGKLYHFEWGLLDRVYAKQNPTPPQLQAHLPEHFKEIVYIGRPQSLAVQRYMELLNLHLRQIEDPQLPGCTVFVRE